MIKWSSWWFEAWEHKSLFISNRLWCLSPYRSNFGMTKSAISLSSPYWVQRTCLQGRTADHAILMWRSTSSLTEGEIGAVTLMPITLTVQKIKKNCSVSSPHNSLWLCSEWHTTILIALFLLYAICTVYCAHSMQFLYAWSTTWQKCAVYIAHWDTEISFYFSFSFYLQLII